MTSAVRSGRKAMGIFSGSGTDSGNDSANISGKNHLCPILGRRSADFLSQKRFAFVKGKRYARAAMAVLFDGRTMAYRTYMLSLVKLRLKYFQLWLKLVSPIFL